MWVGDFARRMVTEWARAVVKTSGMGVGAGMWSATAAKDVAVAWRGRRRAVVLSGFIGMALVVVLMTFWVMSSSWSVLGFVGRWDRLDHVAESRLDRRFVLLRHPPQALCDEVARLDDLLPERQGYPVPHQCRLGVVTVGMPRAGSTLQMKMIFRLLIEKFGEERVKKAYWDLFKHVEMDEDKMEKHITYHRKFLTSLAEEDIFVTKTHEYKPQLTKLCRKTVIVSIRRDLKDTAQSMMRAQWMGPQTLAPFLEASINRHRCWTQHAETIDVGYEKLTEDPLGFMRMFVRASGVDFDDDVVRQVVTNVTSEEANPDIPGGSRLSDDQSDPDKGEDPEFPRDGIIPKWQKQFGYA